MSTGCNYKGKGMHTCFNPNQTSAQYESKNSKVWCHVWTVCNSLYCLTNSTEKVKYQCDSYQKSENIHLSNITQVCSHFFFCHVLVHWHPLNIKLNLSEPRSNQSPSKSTPDENPHKNSLAVCHCLCTMSLFFFTLQFLIKARTKTLPTCISAESLKLNRVIKKMNCLFFFLW